MNLNKILSLFKKKEFWITIACVSFGIIVLSLTSNINESKNHQDKEKTYLHISEKLLSYDDLSYHNTDKNGIFKFTPKTHADTTLKIYNGDIKNNEIIFESKKYNNSEITLDLSKTKNFEQSGGFHIIVVAKQNGLPKNEKSFDLTNKSPLYASYVSSQNSVEVDKSRQEYNESINRTKMSNSNSEQNSTKSSASSDSSDDMNRTINDLVGTSSDFNDVDVNGSYVSDPYNAVITVTSNKDVRIVMSAVLGNLRENAGNKLNNFDSISINIKDTNGNYALKTDYSISTIINNPQIYRPFKVKSLADKWSEY